MSSDDNSDSDFEGSPSFSEEEVFEDVITNPQNEDDEEDNRVFRKWKWHPHCYNLIVGIIKKSGQTRIPQCTDYFWSRSNQRLSFDISRDEGVDTLNLSKLNQEYRRIEENEEVCARIGRHCHKNEGIRYLHLSLSSLEREAIVGFFQHWKGEESQLLGLDMKAPNFGDAGRLGGVGVGEIMGRFLCGNTSLRELHLNWVNMNLNNAIEMATIIGNNSSVPLVNLGLAQNRFGDEGVELLSNAICKISTIRKVNLSETGIQKFSSIMPLINNSSCKLERLDISNGSYDSQMTPTNEIDDEFVSQMAVHLAGNRCLVEVKLPEKNKITEAGWASLLQAVCDTTNFDTLISSNHVLESFGASVKVGKPNEATVWFDEMMGGASCPKLAKVLAINKRGLSPVDSARRKIYLHYFQAAASSIDDDSSPAKSFLPKEVLALDVKLLPMVLSSIGTGKYRFSGVRRYNHYPNNYSWKYQNLQIMYRLVRHMPSILSLLEQQLRGNVGMNDMECDHLKRRIEPTNKESKKLRVESGE
jgi:hypothetical protein